MVFNFKNFFLTFICFILFFLKSTFAETKLFMLTDKTCGVCIVWEKQVGKIYNKTDVANVFPIERLYIDKIDKNKLNAIFKTNVTLLLFSIKIILKLEEFLVIRTPKCFGGKLMKLLKINFFYLLLINNLYHRGVYFKSIFINQG